METTTEIKEKQHRHVAQLPDRGRGHEGMGKAQRNRRQPESRPYSILQACFLRNIKKGE